MGKLPSVPPNGSLPVVGIKNGSVAGIAPFKDNIPPYGAFANTTEITNGRGAYPVVQNQTMSGRPLTINGQQGSITWPSSENAYHAQKIIAYKESLPPNDPKVKVLDNMLLELATLPKPPGNMFLPKSGNPHDPNTYEGLVNRNLAALGFNDKNAFDRACKADYHPKNPNPNAGINPQTGMPHNYEYMKFSLQMKFNQHPELRDMAKECARRGVMPVEISQRDETWASFKNGEGKNLLGVAILELGNEALKRDEGIAGPIRDPHQAYASLQRAAPNQIGYDQLRQYVNSNNGQAFAQMPQQIPAAPRVQAQTTPPAPQAMAPTVQTPPPVPYKQTAPQIQAQPTSAGPQRLASSQIDPNSAMARVMQATGATGVSLVDDNGRPGMKMVKLEFANPQAAEGFAQRAGGAPRDGSAVLLGEMRAATVFNNLNIGTHGKSNPHLMLDALKHDLAQRIQLSQAPHTYLPMNHHHQQHHQMQHRFQAPQQSPTIDPNSSMARVMQATGATGVSLVDDAGRPGQKMVKLEFANPKAAENFAQRAGGAPRDGNNAVLMGEVRAAQVFNNLNIGTHGKSNPHPMLDALKHDLSSQNASTRMKR